MLAVSKTADTMRYNVSIKRLLYANRNYLFVDLLDKIFMILKDAENIFIAKYFVKIQKDK